jgi:hypothetical protein
MEADSENKKRKISEEEEGKRSRQKTGKHRKTTGGLLTFDFLFLSDSIDGAVSIQSFSPLQLLILCLFTDFVCCTRERERQRSGFCATSNNSSYAS